jgi:hypothetical protein
VACDSEKAEAARAAAEALVAERVAAAAEVEGQLAEVGGQLAAVQAELVAARQMAEERGAQLRQVEEAAQVHASSIYCPTMSLRVTGTVTQSCTRSRRLTFEEIVIVR